jgi:hypothetical protein
MLQIITAPYFVQEGEKKKGFHLAGGAFVAARGFRVLFGRM